MKSHQLFEDETKAPRCPNCSHILSAATGISGDSQPKELDITVCISCAAILLFDDKLHLRFPTDDEMENLRVRNPEVGRLRALISQKAERRGLQ